jgi:hypothetical protein
MTAIVAGDILVKFSVVAAAGNTTAGTAAGALGDQISTTQWTGGTLHDLFDAISGPENAANTVDYRCVFFHNNNASNPWENAVAWLSSEVAGGASLAIGVIRRQPRLSHRRRRRRLPLPTRRPPRLA